MTKMAIETKSRIGSSYLPAKGEATRALPDADKANHAKFALIIPTLSESANVRLLLPRIFAVLDRLPIDSEILVVDDASGDGIEEAVAAVARSEARVGLLKRQERGLAGAILHGWRHTDATLLGVMDADLQHPPELIPQLVQSVLSGADLALGSRYPSGSPLGWHPGRRLLSYLAIGLTRPLLGPAPQVSDPMSGYFVVRRECIEGIDFETRGFKLLLEILVRSRVRTVNEIPFTFGRRAAGRSKATPRVAFEYMRLLAKLYRAQRTARVPFQEAAAD